MNKVFYPKLAGTNLVRNRSTYLPYSLACICCMSMFYILHAISVNLGINEMSGSEAIKMILSLGTVVVGIFSVIFLFYTNSFLMKRRKKEIGLYNILGMEKKHIAKMLIFETLLVSLVCLIAGLLCGILFSKLIFLLLLKILNFKVPFVFVVSVASLKITTALFLVIFILTLLTNLMHIRLSKPIELLKGGQVGEKEPKTKWLMTLLGTLALGIGYGIAIIVESPLLAISLFFIAVLLVMFGTYALFTAGSIVFLKMLRKNKKYYYQARHFTSVSNMIYRMKQNAVGLANICILSCAVLVMLSTTVSLYVGVDDALRMRFPKDIMISYKEAPIESSEKMSTLLHEQGEESKVTISEEIAYHSIALIGKKEGQTFTLSEEGPSYEYYLLNILTVDDYNQMEDRAVTLEGNEVLVFSNSEDYGKKDLRINSLSFKVKEEVKHIRMDEKSSVSVFNNYFIVVKDLDTVRKIYENVYGKELINLDYFVGYNIKGTEIEISSYTTSLKEELSNQISSDIFVESKQFMRESFFMLYGGLLFLGIFLGLLFLMATALIIYYKQLSEGYDDQERFAIMQKVGMSHQEVKRTIKSQILIVFFLPLLASVVHIAVAFKMITRLLAVLNLVNIPLFFWCTVATICVFAIIYAGVYLLTARAYYKLVKTE